MTTRFVSSLVSHLALLWCDMPTLSSSTDDIGAFYTGRQSEDELSCIRAKKFEIQTTREVDACVAERMKSGLARDDCLNPEVYKTAPEAMKCINAWMLDCACSSLTTGADDASQSERCMLAKLRSCGATRAVATEMTQGSKCTVENGCQDRMQYKCWQEYDETNGQAYRKYLSKHGCCSEGALHRFFLLRTYLGERVQLACNAYLEWKGQAVDADIFRQELVVATIIVVGIVIVAVLLIGMKICRQNYEKANNFPLHLHNPRLLASGHDGVPRGPYYQDGIHAYGEDDD